MAREWGLKSYKDEDFHSDPKNQEYCIVCLNSLEKITHVPKYDLLVIDECVFVHYHFASNTIRNPGVIYTALIRLIGECTNLILLQHRIPIETIDWYTSIMRQTKNQITIKRWKVDEPTELTNIIRFFTDREQTQYMIAFYLAQLGPAHQNGREVDPIPGTVYRNKEPFIIFCTRIKRAKQFEQTFHATIDTKYKNGIFVFHLLIYRI